MKDVAFSFKCVEEEYRILPRRREASLDKSRKVRSDDAL